MQLAHGVLPVTCNCSLTIAHTLHRAVSACKSPPSLPRPSASAPAGPASLLHACWFWQFGRITAISYKQGFAFIDYEDTNDASDAISNKDGQTMWGRKISVELSKDAKTLAEQGDKRERPPPPRRDDGRSPGPPPRRGDGEAAKNLFVANIPEGVTEADVQDYFAQCAGRPPPSLPSHPHPHPPTNPHTHTPGNKTHTHQCPFARP